LGSGAGASSRGAYLAADRTISPIGLETGASKVAGSRARSPIGPPAYPYIPHQEREKRREEKRREEKRREEKRREERREEKSIRCVGIPVLRVARLM